MKNYNNIVYLHLQRNLELPFPFALAKFILVEYLAAFTSWLVEALRYSLDEWFADLVGGTVVLSCRLS